MPAMLDDPTARVIYRTSGDPPYPTPYASLPPTIVPRQVTLRDRSTIATLVPFSAHTQVPESLVAYLCALLNREIEKGDTYPMINPLPEESFGPYWFANFGAVMFLGEVGGVENVWDMERDMEAREDFDWGKRCLGSFYVKPNYPGRSSHVCNGGFLVTDAARNRGVGRLMGEGYLEWAPKLGYTYSVFNLVYETNIASMRIWDALGFKRIGRVPGCGNLKSHPDTLIDAIIFGRDLNGEAEDYLSEERFDKIRYYLKTGMYPNGSDRAEKSRLRSAGAHYRLVTDTDSSEEKLMLKDKEVISDPQKQYEIAHKTHSIAHAGINKTTASIADKYHWIRIKETVSQAIRNCAECRESSKPSSTKPAKGAASGPDRGLSPKRSTSQQQQQSSSTPGPNPCPLQQQPSVTSSQQQASAGSEQHPLSPPAQHEHSPGPDNNNHQGGLSSHIDPHDHPIPLADMNAYPDYDAMPVDPQIMGYQSHGFGVDQPHAHQQQHHPHHHHHQFDTDHMDAESTTQHHQNYFGNSGSQSNEDSATDEAKFRAEMEAEMGGTEGSGSFQGQSR